MCSKNTTCRSRRSTALRMCLTIRRWAICARSTGNATRAKARSPPFIAPCSSTAPATSAPCPRRCSASTPMPFSPRSATTKVRSPSCVRRRRSNARGPATDATCLHEGPMRHIDAFCHFFPPRLFEKMSRTTGGTKDIGKRIQGVRTIHDLDARLKMMDEFGDYAEILSLGLPPLEAMAGPQEAAEFARTANDGLAELCAKHPDRFAGYVGALPMNAPAAAAKEAERILIHGNANGLQLHTNVNGACLDEPRFFPIFEVAAKSGKPVLLHPARTPNVPDFPAETKSKYEIWAILGWPYETSCTMARLIFSGVTTRLPDLKILIHHLGAMIPFF